MPLLNNKVVNISLLSCFLGFSAIATIHVLSRFPSDISLAPTRVSPESQWYSLGSDVSQLDDWSDLPSSDGFCESFPNGIRQSRQILAVSEHWELGREGGPKDQIGYTSIVRNSHGKDPDNKYYLFYSIHDAGSSIAMAVSETIDGNFTKLANLELGRSDSVVLRSPLRPYSTSHYASPVIIWNSTTQLWHMYFHFYDNRWGSGLGHQHTAVAFASNLNGDWEVYKDSHGYAISVLPVTKSRWMNSQSSYHFISKLSNGKWIALLRGTGGSYIDGEWAQDTTKIGAAISDDGIKWALLNNEAVLAQDSYAGARTGNFRPLLLTPCEKGGFLLAWSEAMFYDSNPIVRYGYTKNFSEISVADAVIDWQPADGPASLISGGQQLYIANGRFLHALSPDAE